MTKRKIKKLSKNSITIYRKKPELSEAIKNRIKLFKIKLLLDLSQDIDITDKELVDAIIDVIYGKI